MTMTSLLKNMFLLCSLQDTQGHLLQLLEMPVKEAKGAPRDEIKQMALGLKLKSYCTETCTPIGRSPY